MTDIITRQTGVDAKGSPLTNTEVDTNFINLKTSADNAQSAADNAQSDATQALSDANDAQLDIDRLERLTVRSSDYTLILTNYRVYADGTSNTVTITLPTAIGNLGLTYSIKCINDTFTVDVATFGAEKIDGDTLNFEIFNHEVIDIQSDGANWWLV
jgi:hypothetical protein